MSARPNDTTPDVAADDRHGNRHLHGASMIPDSPQPKSSAGTVRSSQFSRLLDRQVGRIILWLVGSIRCMWRRKLSEPATIGICVLGAIGDALLASAIVTDLKRRYPNAQVIMIVSKTNAGIVPLLPQCDGFLVLPIFDPLQALSLMRRRRFDLLIDANQWLRISAVYCALSRARYTVGFRTSGQDRHYAFDSVVHHSASRHEIENYRALIAGLTVVGRDAPLLRTTRQDRQFVRALLRSDRHVVLHPWAGGGDAARKEWPIKSWVVLSQAMVVRGYEIVITGAPGDAAKTERLVDAARDAGVMMTALAGRLTLGQTAAILESAALVVSVNTGVMHMAAALDVPLVALHGPTNPDRWGPLSSSAVNVVPLAAPQGVPVGYLNLGFEFPDDAPDCMPFISVDDVLSAIETVASRGRRMALN